MLYRCDAGGKQVNYFKLVLDRIRYNPLPRILIDGLDRLGIKINLIYLMREGITQGIAQPSQDSLEGFEVGFLEAEDMAEMAQIPYRTVGCEKLLGRLEDGNLCLGAKREGRLVGFTWCNLTRCHSKAYPFLLNDDEAYLFDTYTAPDLRGQGLAPALRYRLYEELARMGRTKLYSISERFNAPALRFKLKLGVEILKSNWGIVLFRRWRFGPKGQRP